MNRIDIYKWRRRTRNERCCQSNSQKSYIYGIEVYGIHRGFMGLINSDFIKLDISSG